MFRWIILFKFPIHGNILSRTKTKVKSNVIEFEKKTQISLCKITYTHIMQKKWRCLCSADTHMFTQFGNDFYFMLKKVQWNSIEFIILSKIWLNTKNYEFLSKWILNIKCENKTIQNVCSFFRTHFTNETNNTIQRLYCIRTKQYQTNIWL